MVMMRRHPLVIFLYVLAVLAALTYLAAGAPPGSVDALLPGGLVLLWYGALALGGLIGIAAALWREPLTGIMIERVAMLPLAVGALVYVTALVVLGQVAVLYTAGLVAAFGVAAILRAVQITRQLRALHAKTMRAKTKPPGGGR